jgi:hypothetical protein
MPDITIWEAVRFFLAAFGGSVAVTVGIRVGLIVAEHIRMELCRHRCERVVKAAIERAKQIPTPPDPPRRVLAEPLRFMAPADRQMN